MRRATFGRSPSGWATLRSRAPRSISEPTLRRNSKPWRLWSHPTYGVVGSDRRISYSRCFDPNRSSVMRRPKPLNCRFRGSICRPTPHIYGRRIFPPIHRVHGNQNPHLRRDLQHAAYCPRSPRIKAAKSFVGMPFSSTRSLAP